MTTAWDELISSGKARFELDFAETGQKFDDLCWELSHLAKKSTSYRNINLHFVRYKFTKEPLPKFFTLPVRCWLLQSRGSSVENLQISLLTVRVFWEAILKRRGCDESSFEWNNLSLEDLSQTENIMREIWALSTTSKNIRRVLQLTSFLGKHGICPNLKYTPQTARQKDNNVHLLADQEKRRDKLPSKQALEGLADIFANHDIETRDRLRIAAIAILIATGFRVSELLTLPENCEVYEKNGNQLRYGIRYFADKSGDGVQGRAVRWLTNAQAELAQRAISELRDLTLRARERAKTLEVQFPRVCIPSYEDKEFITVSELGIAINSSSTSYTRRLMRTKKVSLINDSLYKVSEIEQMLSQWQQPLYTVKIDHNKEQKLSETLLLHFRNTFQSKKPTNTLIVESWIIQHINDAIGLRTNQSLFKLYNITEENGETCSISSHQFRHWLNDLADKGGLPIDQLTRWMGRKNSRDTQAYRHATVDERIDWLKDELKEGHLSGDIANLYINLPDDERDTFLDGQIQAVHITPLGYCVHDFAIEPCPYHLNCLGGCSHYLRKKGDEAERSNLIRIRDITVKSLESAELAIEERGVSDAWVRHNQNIIAGIDAALAVDDSDTEGDFVQVFNKENANGKTK